MPCMPSEIVEQPRKRLKRCGTICVKSIFGQVNLLVVRGKRSHIWSLPKGCINEGEEEWRCAQRETQEETGLWVEIRPDTHARVCINHNVYFVYQVSSNHAKLQSRDHAEIDKVSWMTLEELRNFECNKDLRSILQYPTRKFGFHHLLRDVLQLDTLRPVTPSSSEVSTEEDEVGF